MREWLRDIRLKTGKSTYKQAKEIGISQSYYFAIENGGRGKHISGSMAKKIASVMGFRWQMFYEDLEDKSA